MTMTDDAAVLIRHRLDELSAERAELEQALRGLERATKPASSRRGRRPATSKPRRRARGRGPTRKQEVLAQVKANPAIGTAEIATAVGISSNQVSNLLRQLRRDGVLGKATAARNGSSGPSHAAPRVGPQAPR